MSAVRPLLFNPGMAIFTLSPLRSEAVEGLREHLPGRVVEVIAVAVGILVDVYDRNRGQHETDSGDDAMSLGVRNWRNWWNLLDDRLSDIDDVEVSRPRGSLQAIVDEFVLHFWSGEDSTAVRFDNGHTKPQIVAENAAQMTLWTDDSSRCSVSTEWSRFDVLGSSTAMKDTTVPPRRLMTWRAVSRLKIAKYGTISLQDFGSGNGNPAGPEDFARGRLVRRRHRCAPQDAALL